MGTALSVAAVGQDTCAVVEHVYNGDLRKLSPGLHVLPPFVYRFRGVDWHFTDDAPCPAIRDCFIPLYDLCYDPPPLECRSADGVDVEVDLVLYFGIDDPVKAVSKVDNLYLSVQNHVATATFRAVLQLSLNELTPVGIEKLLDPRALSKDLSKWGVALRSIEVQSICLPESISDATTHTLAQQRKGEAELVKLEQEHQRRVRMAETEMAEQQARQQREQSAHEHKIRLKDEESERVAREAVRAAESEAASIRARGLAEAEAIAAKAKARNDSLKVEHEILAQHPEALPFFQSRAQAEAWGAVAASDNTKLVVAPGDALLAAARNPLAGVFARLQAPAEQEDAAQALNWADAEEDA